MPKKIPDETKRLIENMYAKHLSVAEIARRTEVPYVTVYVYTRAKERGFASRIKYQECSAREKGFKSYHDYQKRLAEKKGFASYTAYQEDLAKRKGFNSYTAYQEHLAEDMGFASRLDYRKYLAEKKGYASLAKYNAHLDSEKQRKPRNKKLSHWLKQKLAERGKNKSWLANQLGITRGTVSRYASGKMMPGKDLQEKLFSLLEVPYQTIDDLLVELK